jgi:hypothetical protein
MVLRESGTGLPGDYAVAPSYNAFYAFSSSSKPA